MSKRREDFDNYLNQKRMKIQVDSHNNPGDEYEFISCVLHLILYNIIFIHIFQLNKNKNISFNGLTCLSK